MIYMT